MPQIYEVSLKNLSGSVITLVLLMATLTGLMSCTAESIFTEQNPHSGRLRLATTTSLYDTGLWDSLEPMFEDRYGVDLDIIVGGTGEVLEAGRRGDVDIVTLHDKIREDEFVSQGHGIQRYPIAYNYFVIVGPESDPCRIKNMEPEAAFLQIMNQCKSDTETIRFISRGDKSGTHAREMFLWQTAGEDYESVRNSGKWYLEAGAGMGAILMLADEKSAYTLAVNSTYRAFKERLDLVSLVDTGFSLLNVYSVIAINQENHPNANVDMSNNLITFLTSEEVQDLIDDYGINKYGTALFTAARGEEQQ
jgi:tungstate transport system substrate-binding protein